VAVVEHQVTPRQIQRVQMAVLVAVAHILIPRQTLLLLPVVLETRQAQRQHRETMAEPVLHQHQIMALVVAAALLPLGLPAHLQRAVTVAMAPHLAFLVRLRPMLAVAAVPVKAVAPEETAVLVAVAQASRLPMELLARSTQAAEAAVGDKPLLQALLIKQAQQAAPASSSSNTLSPSNLS
jgi:hypothetical protein